MMLPPVRLCRKEGLSAQFLPTCGILSAEFLDLSPEKLRRWLLRYAAHRSGRRLQATRVPLARLRLALSRLWLAYPPRLSRRARPALSVS